MESKDANNPVQEEQFSGANSPENNETTPVNNEAASDANEEVNGETEIKAEIISEIPEEINAQDDIGEGETISEQEEAPVSEEIKEINDAGEDIPGVNLHEESSIVEGIGEIEEIDEKAMDAYLQNYSEETITDYSAMPKEELIIELERILEAKPVHSIHKDVDLIKIFFYKRNKAEIERKKKTFLEEGGNIEDFKAAPDPLENDLKELLKKFKDQKATFNRDLEDEKEKNLHEKYKVIEEIKELVNRKESINDTFHEFRELQKRWRNTGIVPQQKIKDLWETYHHHVEKFYDYIKINKELRDLDLKKNQEAKILLCEKTEELLFENSVVNAFKQLQIYHEQWREIGPVPNEMKATVWERFKEATSKINKKHQQYFQDLKKAEQKNLEDKTSLCEKVEELCNMEISTLKDWNNNSKEVIEIQKVWRTIGFAPKKHNNKIYTRFREACDTFFARKREFFSEHKQEEDKNLQLKTDLCMQAEALQESNDWKKTTEDFIELQKKWKGVGPVSRKDSEIIWKRFRAACDHFFNTKEKFFSKVDTQYENNLKLKNELISEIENFVLGDDHSENFKKLKEFQKRWTEIGFVPFEFKDEIQNKYRNIINKQFDRLEVDEQKKSSMKFKNKLETLKQKPSSDFRIDREREKYINRLKKLESNLVLWENNIGFFTSSKTANSMINSFKEKIEQAKSDIEMLKNKIRMIDETFGE